MMDVEQAVEWRFSGKRFVMPQKPLRVVNLVGNIAAKYGGVSFIGWVAL